MTNLENMIIDVPVLPLRGIVVFPKMMLHFDVVRKESIAAINRAMTADQLVFAVAQEDASKSTVVASDLYQVGTVSKVVQMVKQPDGSLRVVLEGLYRAEIKYISEGRSGFLADIIKAEETEPDNSLNELALVRSLKSSFESYVKLNPKLPADIMFKIGLSENAGELSDYIASNIVLDYRKKQSVLEQFDSVSRIESLIELINDELVILEIERDINERTRSNIDHNQRDMYLREELRAIREELGDYDEAETDDLKEKIKSLKLKPEIEELLLKECSKMERMPYGSQEAALIKTYLDTCLELPWNTYTTENIDLDSVRKELDKNHFGLTKVKERIIESLAVRKLNPDSKGNILCLVGPPGIGKTSIAVSVGEAIGRNTARISLGGVKDEAEIRGHRRTYLASMPGRIISGIKRAKSSNPLLVLDEIDKLSNDYKGDPTSALLEVLDSEQNFEFHDHYLDIPYDLSKVMFITTANDLHAIPEPLRDRMDVIELPSYTREEKFHIAKKHLIKKQLQENGLTAKSFKISDSAIYSLIDSYTKEAGVRSLERIIAGVMRKSAVKLVDGEEKIKVDKKDLEAILGPKKYQLDLIENKDLVGVVNGLAWTSVGGELLPVEVAVNEGTGKIELTGSLGDVMKESAKTAITCIRSISDKYNIDKDFYKNKDIHIHAPEGAVPKDGPSAGITMATALFSALTGKAVKQNVAMTGEITLRGRVLPIGGLKEKSMAAFKSGVKTVIIPLKNLPDVAEIDPIVKEHIEFIAVESIDEVLNNSLALMKNSKSTRRKISADTRGSKASAIRAKS
ncbi:MAG: endopeptidase La [Clostridia bacterium]|nr:endopeptidase La [Clostridia bacterium]